MKSSERDTDFELVPREWNFDHAIDSLDNGCGQLLLDLKLAFREFGGGDRVMVASRDAGAPVELPAWCRLTGHELVAAKPPFYLIVKRNRKQGD